jgi:hypothetical protein
MAPAVKMLVSCHACQCCLQVRSCSTAVWGGSKTEAAIGLAQLPEWPVIGLNKMQTLAQLIGESGVEMARYHTKSEKGRCSHWVLKHVTCSR